jgi:hypothetical protein
MGAAQVLRPNARGEAVFRVVGVADHFLFSVERRDRNHGSEDFLAVYSATDGQAGDDGRREKITASASVVRRRGRGPAEGDRTAFLLRELDIKPNFVQLRPRDDRALVGIVFKRVPYPEL